jgi:hypothetical protein
MKDYGNIEVSCWAGRWYKRKYKVVRITKTMIIIQVNDNGYEERYNRKNGRKCGREPGIRGMVEPYIDIKEIKRFHEYNKLEQPT